jgi:hypothetical protein
LGFFLVIPPFLGALVKKWQKLGTRCPRNIFSASFDITTLKIDAAVLPQSEFEFCSGELKKKWSPVKEI